MIEEIYTIKYYDVEFLKSLTRKLNKEFLRDKTQSRPTLLDNDEMDRLNLIMGFKRED